MGCAKNTTEKRNVHNVDKDPKAYLGKILAGCKVNSSIGRV